MPIHDLTDEFLAHVEDMLNRGRVYIEADMLQMGITTGTPPKVPDIKIIVGDTIVDSNFPIIRITPGSPMTSEWMATRVRKDRYQFNIDVDMRVVTKDNRDRFIMGISNSVKNWMLQFANLSGQIYLTNASYFNAWAESTTAGAKGNNTIRTARFNWWAEVANSYHEVYP